MGTLLLIPAEVLPQACWSWDLAKPRNPASGKRGGWKEAEAHRAAGLELAGQRGWRPGLPTSPGPCSASPLLHSSSETLQRALQWAQLGPRVLRALRHAVMSDSATPWAAAHQAPLSMDSPGKNTGLGCCFLLQGIFLTQGLSPHLLHWPADSVAEPPGKPVGHKPSHTPVLDRLPCLGSESPHPGWGELDSPPATGRWSWTHSSRAP